MRTTLTLDKDVAVRLRRLQERRRLSLKEAVNQVMREGLERLEERPKRRARFRLKPLNLGRCLLPSLANIAGVLDLIEGETHK